MMGAPPVAGFVSKWYLGMGALEVEQDWVLLVLVGSGLLNAMYFLPLVYRGWFGTPSPDWPDGGASKIVEAPRLLLYPALFTASLSLLAGIFAGSDISPLNWAQLVVNREFDL